MSYLDIMNVSIWIRPLGKASRKRIYEELKDQPDKIEELKNKVFLPEKAYPKRKGRKPKYDFLLISIEGINDEKAPQIAEFFQGHFNRMVVWYSVILSKKYYRFIIPWRDPETGKSIKTGRGVFPELRGKIKEVIRGGPPSISHTMENNLPEEEIKPEWLPEGMYLKPEPFEEKETKKEKTHTKDEEMVKNLEELSNILTPSKEEGIKKLKKLIMEYADTIKDIDDLNEEMEKWKKKATSSILKSDRKKAQKKLEILKQKQTELILIQDYLKKEITKTIAEYHITEEESNKIVDEVMGKE